MLRQLHSTQPRLRHKQHAINDKPATRGPWAAVAEASSKGMRQSSNKAMEASDKAVNVVY
jgi:hypothetical protein